MEILHHATLVRVGSVSAAELPLDRGLYEVQDQYIDRFGIDDARELVKKAVQRPIETETQVLVVRTEFITLEAQNALLKILEEPPVSTKIIFVVPSGLTMLPTVLSRIHEEMISGEAEEEGEEPFQVFLSQSYKDRLAAIESAMKKKDVVWQQKMKRGLIRYVGTVSKTVAGRSDLEYVARTLLTRGASNKMLLEHAALVLVTRE